MKLIVEYKGQNFIYVCMAYIEFSQNSQLLSNISWRCLYQISPELFKKYGKYSKKCIYTLRSSKTTLEYILTELTLA